MCARTGLLGASRASLQRTHIDRFAIQRDVILVGGRDADGHAFQRLDDVLVHDILPTD
jgi:hypothetical protein